MASKEDAVSASQGKREIAESSSKKGEGRIKGSERKDAVRELGEKHSGPERYKIDWSGKREAVEITGEARAAMAERLRSRLEVAKELLKDEKRLSWYDTLLLEKGEGLIDKLDGNDSLQANEMAAALTVIKNDLLEKVQATARSVEKTTHKVHRESDKFRRLKKLPGVGDILRRYVDVVDEETTGVTSSNAPRFSSDYIEKLGYAELKDEEIEKDLVELNNLRVVLEKRMGFKSDEDWKLPDFQKKTADRLHNSVVEQMRKIMDTEHGGKTFLELHNTDPIAAALVRHEAMQRGLRDFAPEMGRDILQAKHPKVDTTVIEKHVVALKKPKYTEDELQGDRDTLVKATKVYEEAEKKVQALQMEQGVNVGELKKERADVNRTKSQYTYAESRYNDMLQKYSGMKQSLPGLKAASAEAESVKEAWREEKAEELTLMQTRVGSLETEIERLISDKKKALEGLNSKDKIQVEKEYESKIQIENANKKRLEDRLDSLRVQAREAFVDAARKKSVYESTLQMINDWEGKDQKEEKTDPNDPNKKIEVMKNDGELSKVEERMEFARINKENAEEALEIKRKNLLDLAEEDMKVSRKSKEDAEKALSKKMEHVIPEKEAQAEGLRGWERVAQTGNYKNIIDVRFDQHGYGTKYTRDKLGDQTEDAISGNIKGAELIREHIFGVTDPAWWAKAENRELARKMVSDEAIARAIIHTFRVDVSGGKIDIKIPKTDGSGEMQDKPGCNFRVLFEEFGKKEYVDDKEKKYTALEEQKRALKEEEASKTPDTTTLEKLRDKLKSAQSAYNEYLQNEKVLLQALLPNLKNADQFPVGDMIRFLVHEGVDSAHRGEPYLKVPEYYEKQKPELQVEAETILGKDMGVANVEMDDRTREQAVIWEGDLTKIPRSWITGEKDQDIFNPSLLQESLHCKVEQQFGSSAIDMNVLVQVNEDLLKILPARRESDTPVGILEVFYTGAGDLMRREAMPWGKWIRVHKDEVDKTGDTFVLDWRRGRRVFSSAGEIGSFLTSSSYVAQDARFNTLGRFSPRTVENVRMPLRDQQEPDFKNYQVTYEQDRFFVQEQDRSGNLIADTRQQLEAFRENRARKLATKVIPPKTFTARAAPIAREKLLDAGFSEENIDHMLNNDSYLIHQESFAGYVTAEEVIARLQDNEVRQILGKEWEEKLEIEFQKIQKAIGEEVITRSGAVASETAIDRQIRFMNELSSEAGDKIPVALAESVLGMSPADRLQLIRGLGKATQTVAVTQGGTIVDKPNSEITFDNAGNFWISLYQYDSQNGNLTSKKERELGAFLEQELVEFKRNIGHEELTPEDQNDFRDRHTSYLSSLGKEILSMLQKS